MSFLLTTGVKKNLRNSGQSLLEFVILLPVMVGMTAVLIRVNSAIQMSIVNQQYARAHILWLNFNSATYPQRSLIPSNFTSKGYNQMVIGVAENSSPEEGSDRYQPFASTQFITRLGRKGADQSSPQEEPVERDNIRIRNTISICTQSNVLNGNGSFVAATPENLSRSGEGEGQAGALFAFCRSPIE